MSVPWKSGLITAALLLFLVGSGFLLLREGVHRVNSIALGPPHLDNLYWSLRIRLIGGTGAYNEFAHSIEGETPMLQHDLAHDFGRILYQNLGLKGFAVCDLRFSAGCFHELAALAIEKSGTNAASLLDQNCIDALGFQAAAACQHGIGHGLVAYYGYSLGGLAQALGLCSQLPAFDKNEGCYGGAFMEYNFYTMAGFGGNPRPLLTSDMYDPCNHLSGVYQPSCYFWLPQWWKEPLMRAAYSPYSEKSFLTLQSTCEASATSTPECAGWIRNSKNVFAQIGIRCAALSFQMARACFSGIGYFVLPDAHFDSQLASSYCSAASENPSYQKSCLLYTQSNWIQSGDTLAQALSLE